MRNNFDPTFDGMPESLSDRRFVHLEHPVYQEKDLRTYLDWTLARKSDAEHAEHE